MPVTEKLSRSIMTASPQFTGHGEVVHTEDDVVTEDSKIIVSFTINDLDNATNWSSVREPHRIWP